MRKKLNADSQPWEVGLKLEPDSRGKNKNWSTTKRKKLKNSNRKRIESVHNYVIKLTTKFLKMGAKPNRRYWWESITANSSKGNFLQGFVRRWTRIRMEQNSWIRMRKYWMQMHGPGKKSTSSNPTLMISAPERMSSSTISPVTTLPAIMVIVGNSSRT